MHLCTYVSKGDVIYFFVIRKNVFSYLRKTVFRKYEKQFFVNTKYCNQNYEKRFFVVVIYYFEAVRLLCQSR